jgi:hypothetical protein
VGMGVVAHLFALVAKPCTAGPPGCTSPDS